jgi:hypothetical protein
MRWTKHFAHIGKMINSNKMEDGKSHAKSEFQDGSYGSRI